MPRSGTAWTHPVRSLRFADPVEERRFCREYDAAALPHARVAAALAILLYGAFGILDAIVAPDDLGVLLLIRFAFVCPFIATALVLSWLLAPETFAHLQQRVICTVVLVASLGLDAMSLVADVPRDYTRTGNLLILVYLFTFTRVRFLNAVVTGLVVTFAYEASQLLDHAPWQDVVYNAFFLVAFLTIGVLNCHTLESLRRREYLAERAALSARAVAAADAERQRLERDLHDGAQQHLVLLKMKLGLAARAEAAAAAQLHAEMAADADRALRELRDLAHGLYPVILADDGLLAALRDAARRSPLPARVHGEIARHPPEIEMAVYYCCLEALQNAAKHAGPGAEVDVRVEEDGGSLAFEVADDGAGFDEPAGTGVGLANMRDRVVALGGELVLWSRPGRGTRVSGRVPIAKPSRAGMPS